MKLFFYVTLAFAILSSTVSQCAQFQASATPAYGTEERNRLYNEEATKRLTQALEELDEEAAGEALRAGVDPTYNENGSPRFFALARFFQVWLDGNMTLVNRQTSEKINKLAQLLLDNNADINVRRYTTFGTALHSATSTPVSFVRLIIDAGADINAKGNGERTPLMLSIIEESPDVVEFLLSRGADTTTLRDFSGKTALDHLLQKTQDYIKPQGPGHHLINKENLNAMFEIFIEYFSQKQDQTSLDKLKEMYLELKYSDSK